MTASLSNNTVQAWRAVLDKIRAAAEKAQRDSAGIQLLAVSKTFPLAAIQTLLQAGQHAFGESYAQALQEKALALPQVQWHFIGPVQSNKTRIIARYASWVHSVDDVKILQRLSAQRPTDLPALNICLQVNVSGERTKRGVSPPQLQALAETAIQYDNLCLRGLMAIPAAAADNPTLRSQFAMLRRLLDDLNQRGFSLDTLSMGMSADLEIAIAEGATIVRVGTAIFGGRDNGKKE